MIFVSGNSLLPVPPASTTPFIPASRFAQNLMIQYRGDSVTNPVYRRIAIAILLFVFSVSVFRAWTQSITHDEAFFQSLFLTGSLSRLFDSYDASHHVLHTILCKISISLFGLSEFTLRLPSLLGGLLCLVTFFRLSRRLFGDGPLFLLSVSLLALNPQVLDYMSAARGYGLALALLLWALYQMLEYAWAAGAPGGGLLDASRIYKASIALALSVASNLTFLVPATALALVFLSVLAADGALGGDPRAARRLSSAIDSFVLPGVVTAFVIVILPLTKAKPGSFYVGRTSLGESMTNLVLASLCHHRLSGRLTALLPVADFLYVTFVKVLVPAVFAATILACTVALRRWVRRRSFRDLEITDQFLLLCGGSMLLAVGMLVAANRVFQLLYPQGRTGLYLAPLFTLTALTLWASIRKYRVLSLLTGLPLAAVAVLCLVQFVAEFQVTRYSEWRFDAATKRIVQLIRERHAKQPRARVRVGNTAALEPAINFYRRLYKLDWMQPVTRETPDGHHDYYVLTEQDTPLIEKLGLTVLFVDAGSGTALAVPGTRPPAP